MIVIYFEFKKSLLYVSVLKSKEFYKLMVLCKVYLYVVNMNLKVYFGNVRMIIFCFFLFYVKWF